MYLAADLTGVDLRSQDISFLVGLGTNFEGAKLTEAQRRQLRNGERHDKKLNVRKQLRNMRIHLIGSFIDRHMHLTVPPTNDGPSDRTEYLQKSATPFEELLTVTLLNPVEQNLNGHSRDDFGSDYMSAALLAFCDFFDKDFKTFFEDLFQLFGDIYAPIDEAVIEVLKRHYRHGREPKLSDLLARLRPTGVLDTWWILDQDGFQAMIDSARELSRHRKVHAEAIESFVTEVGEINMCLKMLTIAQYDIEADRAERIAYMIVSRKWPSIMVPQILSAEVPRPLQIAFFRQLIEQANSERVVMVLEWLDQDRGAVGVLSLENTIQQIDDFSELYLLAKRLSTNLRPSQRKALTSRLLQLARSDAEIAQVRRLG